MVCSPLSSLVHWNPFCVPLGLPGGSAERIRLQCRRRRFNPWVGEIPLEESMATHSSTVAWKIPWTEGPCGLQSVVLQEVGHEATEHMCL